MKNEKSEAYTKYIERLKTGGSMPYLDVEDWEDIVYDLSDDYEMESAHYALAEGLRQHPDSSDLKKLHIMLLVREHRTAEAREELKPYLTDGTYETLRLVFALHAADGHPKQALRYLTERLQAGDLLPVEVADLINEFWDDLEDDTDAVHDTAVALLDRFTGDAEALVELGIILADTDDLSSAATAYERALDVDAYNMKAWHNAVRSYFELEEYDRCLEACDFALAIDDYSPIIHFARAYCYYESERWSEALNDLLIAHDHVIEMQREGRIEEEYATDEDAQRQLCTSLDLISRCYQQLGDTKKAIGACIEWLKLEPKNHDVCFWLACQMMDQGDTETAMTYIDRAIELCPRKTSYLACRVTMLSMEHRFDEAMKDLDRLVALSPRSSSFLLAKGQLAYDLGQTDVADASFRSLLRLHPKDALSRKTLTDYFTQIGDDEALKEID